MKMLCAVFKNERYNTTFIAECDESLECFADTSQEYIRLSATIEVEFPELPKETIIAKQLAALDRMKDEVMEAFAAKLEAIEHKRAELLALPAPSATEEGEAS